MNKAIIALMILVSLLLVGCDSYYSKEEFCNMQGYQGWSYIIQAGADYRFFCLNYDECSLEIIEVSRIYQEKDRLKNKACCLNQCNSTRGGCRK